MRKSRKQLITNLIKIINNCRAYEPQQLSASQDTFKSVIMRRILRLANSPLIGFKACSIRGYCAWYCNPRQPMAVEIMGSRGEPTTATFLDQHDFLLLLNAYPYAKRNVQVSFLVKEASVGNG